MLPKVGSYGRYSSTNYGAHALYVDIPGFGVLYYSYRTIIAFQTPEDGFLMRENLWGPTTGKHMKWLAPRYRIRLTKEEFEDKLNAALARKGLL